MIAITSASTVIPSAVRQLLPWLGLGVCLQGTFLFHSFRLRSGLAAIREEIVYE
jgi:hypothetical protein